MIRTFLEPRLASPTAFLTAQIRISPHFSLLRISLYMRSVARCLACGHPDCYRTLRPVLLQRSYVQADPVQLTNRLVQFHQKGATHVALVGERDRTLFVLKGVNSAYELIQGAYDKGIDPYTFALEHWHGATVSHSVRDYDDALEKGEIMAPIGHPNPRRFFLCGTGLTHINALDSMTPLHNKEHHNKSGEKHLKKAIEFYHESIETGKHKSDNLEIMPDFSLKGDGTSVAWPEEPVEVPSNVPLGNEKVEIIAIYIVDNRGNVHCAGITLGVEVCGLGTQMPQIKSQGKLRPYALGPELLLGDVPNEVTGTVSVLRKGEVVWQADFMSGQLHLAHSLKAMEHEHFKHTMNHKPGDVHAHFLGESLLGLSRGFKTQDGDKFEVSSPFFAQPLRNPLKVIQVEEQKTRKVDE